jgi:hypothetical protein
MSTSYDHRAVWVRFAQSEAALRKVTLALGKAGVPVLAVKGIVTSSWLYDGPGERPLTDVDVRVRPRDFRKSIEVVEAAKWRVARKVWSYRNLIFDVGGVPIDLESYVGPPGVTELSVDEMFARATRDDRGFWIPEMYDHGVLLTVNVFKDKLRWAFPWAVEDALRIVRKVGFEPERFVGRVHDAKVVAPTWLVADWLARKHGSHVWGTIRGLLGGDQPARKTYLALARRFFASDDRWALPPRILLRAGSDSPSLWGGAMARAAVWELESRWDARRRGRPQRF